jgi:hypothetical protein
VPVTDLAVHRTEKDLVVGSYGRGLWIADASFMRELSDSLLNQQFHLFSIAAKPQFNYSQRAEWGNYNMMGDNHLRTENEQNGLEVYYYLKSVEDKDDVFLRITDLNEKNTDIKVPKSQGLHCQYLRTERLKPGHYKISLLVGKNRVTQPAEVTESPVWPVGFISPGSAR